MQASALEAEQEALKLTSKSLPSYCMTVAVIMSMDVSDELGNSIDQMEQFVAAEQVSKLNRAVCCCWTGK